MITSKEKNFISAVVYLRNEEPNVREFLNKLYYELNNNYNKFEIICVNDASTDNTKQQIKQFLEDIDNNELPVVSIINMSSYQGIEVSMTAGLDLSIGDFVYEFDSIKIDYDEKLIMDIYYKLLSKGCDCVSAVPNKVRGMYSKLFYTIFNKYSSSHTSVNQESFRIISRRMINRAKSMNKILAYRKAIYATSGLSCSNISYDNSKIFIGGGTKYSALEKINRVECATDSLVIFTNIVQKISIFLSMIFLSISIFMLIYVGWSYFYKYHIVQGWTSTMLFLSFGFFGIFLILTLVLQYLIVILKLIFKQKQYVVESIEKLTNN